MGWDGDHLSVQGQTSGNEHVWKFSTIVLAGETNPTNQTEPNLILGFRGFVLHGTAYGIIYMRLMSLFFKVNRMWSLPVGQVVMVVSLKTRYMTG